MSRVLFWLILASFPDFLIVLLFILLFSFTVLAFDLFTDLGCDFVDEINDIVDEVDDGDAGDAGDDGNAGGGGDEGDKDAAEDAEDDVSPFHERAAEAAEETR